MKGWSLEASKDLTGDLEENHLETEEDLNGEIGKLYLWPLAMKADALPEQRESQLHVQLCRIAEFIAAS